MCLYKPNKDKTTKPPRISGNELIYFDIPAPMKKDYRIMHDLLIDAEKYGSKDSLETELSLLDTLKSYINKYQETPAEKFKRSQLIKNGSGDS